MGGQGWASPPTFSSPGALVKARSSPAGHLYEPFTLLPARILGSGALGSAPAPLFPPPQEGPVVRLPGIRNFYVHICSPQGAWDREQPSP